jgi:hypothetical protein
MSNKLRFHLGRGENFMKWQLRNKGEDRVEYFHPDDSFKITMDSGRLCNSQKTATRIFEGDNKTVCSWISFKSHTMDVDGFGGGLIRISYNPKVKPHWMSYDLPDYNLDGYQGKIFIIGKSIYVQEEKLKEYIKQVDHVNV